MDSNKLKALWGIIGTGAKSAKKNTDFIAELKKMGYDCAQGEMRGLLAIIRKDKTDERVLCAGQDGYFWAAVWAEAKQYGIDLRKRNRSQLMVEQAVRIKTYRQFQQVSIFITPGTLESLGFTFVAERTWWSECLGITVKKSSDTVKYPNTYAIFRGEAIEGEPFEMAAELLGRIEGLVTEEEE